MKKYIFLYEVGIGDVLSHKIDEYIKQEKEKLIDQLSFQFGTDIEHKCIGVVTIPCEGNSNKFSIQQIF